MERYELLHWNHPKHRVGEGLLETCPCSMFSCWYGLVTEKNDIWLFTDPILHHHQQCSLPLCPSQRWKMSLPPALGLWKDSMAKNNAVHPQLTPTYSCLMTHFRHQLAMHFHQVEGSPDLPGRWLTPPNLKNSLGFFPHLPKGWVLEESWRSSKLRRWGPTSAVSGAQHTGNVASDFASRAKFAWNLPAGFAGPNQSFHVPPSGPVLFWSVKAWCPTISRSSNLLQISFHVCTPSHRLPQYRSVVSGRLQLQKSAKFSMDLPQHHQKTAPRDLHLREDTTNPLRSCTNCLSPCSIQCLHSLTGVVSKPSSLPSWGQHLPHPKPHSVAHNSDHWAK